MEELARCLVCGGTLKVLHRDVTDLHCGAPGRFHYSRCAECRSAFLNPRPTGPELNRLYREFFTVSRYAPDSPLPPLAASRRREARRIARRWRTPIPLPPPGGRFLELGCGNGQLLAEVRRLGWEVEGLEPNPDSAGTARTHFGIPVRVGTLETAEIPPESFNAVVLIDVLEHVWDPASTLRRIGSLLRPGGQAVVRFPNVESWAHRLFGKHWFGLCPPWHLGFYPCRALRRLGESAGLLTERLRTTALAAAGIFLNSRKYRLLSSPRGAHPARRERIEALGVRRSFPLTWWPVALAFALAEGMAVHTLLPEAGEETVWILRKPR